MQREGTRATTTTTGICSCSGRQPTGLRFPAFSGCRIFAFSCLLELNSWHLFGGSSGGGGGHQKQKCRRSFQFFPLLSLAVADGPAPSGSLTDIVFSHMHGRTHFDLITLGRVSRTFHLASWKVRRGFKVTVPIFSVKHIRQYLSYVAAVQCSRCEARVLDA